MICYDLSKQACRIANMFTPKIKCKLIHIGKLKLNQEWARELKDNLTTDFFFYFLITKPARPIKEDRFAIAPNHFVADEIVFDPKEQIYLLRNESAFRDLETELKSLDDLKTLLKSYRESGWHIESTNTKLYKLFMTA